jgi:phage FluMu protein Com
MFKVIRCCICNKKLGVVEGKYEIQCPRCTNPKHIEMGNTEEVFYGESIADKLMSTNEKESVE